MAKKKRKFKKAKVDKDGRAYCPHCAHRGSRGASATFTGKQSQQRNEWLARHEKHHLPVDER